MVSTTWRCPLKKVFTTVNMCCLLLWLTQSIFQTYSASSAAWFSSSLGLFFYSMLPTISSYSQMQPSLICVEHSPYSLIVYLVVAAILAATKQPIALAPYITWGFRLTWEEGVLRLNIDQESRWISHLHAVIIGSSLFYTGWCILPYRIQGRDIVRNH